MKSLGLEGEEKISKRAFLIDFMGNFFEGFVESLGNNLNRISWYLQ